MLLLLLLFVFPLGEDIGVEGVEGEEEEVEEWGVLGDPGAEEGRWIGRERRGIDKRIWGGGWGGELIEFIELIEFMGFIGLIEFIGLMGGM